MSERAVPCLDIALLPAADGSGACEKAGYSSTTCLPSISSG